jgi:hypothetical protein
MPNHAQTELPHRPTRGHAADFSGVGEKGVNGKLCVV